MARYKTIKKPKNGWNKKDRTLLHAMIYIVPAALVLIHFLKNYTITFGG